MWPSPGTCSLPPAFAACVTEITHLPVPERLGAVGVEESNLQLLPALPRSMCYLSEKLEPSVRNDLPAVAAYPHGSCVELQVNVWIAVWAIHLQV